MGEGFETDSQPIVTTEAEVCTVFWSAEARSSLRRFRFCFESRKGTPADLLTMMNEVKS